MRYLSSFFKKHELRIAVFLTGMGVLVLEISATRILAPYFGNTIYSVSSVIPVILTALALGYSYGGRLADRRPEETLFYNIILASGLCVLGFYILSIFALPVLSVWLSLTWGPLISSILLFLFPAFLLGILSPFAVALEKKHAPETGVGAVSGNIFFYSTLGSILGGLLTGFVFIPHVGIQTIMTGTGVLLSVLGFAGVVLHRGIPHSSSVGVLLLSAGLAFGAFFGGGVSLSKNIIHAEEGTYSHIQIIDTFFEGRPVRINMLDKEFSGAMHLDSEDADDHVFDYTPYYKIFTLFNAAPAHALVIGGAASYTVPKSLLAYNDTVVVDVAEIDPRLTELAHAYFKVPHDPRLISHARDARALLRTSDTTYDVIFADAFSSLYGIPSHLATKEFFALARTRLSGNGVLIMNVIGDLTPRKRNLVYALMRTFREVFPDGAFFATRAAHALEPQNFIFVGVRDSHMLPQAVFTSARASNDPILAELSERRIDISDNILKHHPLLTDDYAPIEYLVAPSFTRGDY